MAEELGARVDALLAPYMNRPFLGASIEDGKKLQLELNNLQKELRLIKQEIAINEREIYARHTNERISVRTGAVANRFAGGWLGLFTRAGTASIRASIQHRQQQELVPYINLRNWIDEKLIEIDRIKLDIQQNMAKLPAISKTAPPVTHTPHTSNPAPTRLSESEYFATSSRWGRAFVTNLNAFGSLVRGGSSLDRSKEDLLREAATYVANIRYINAEVFACTPPPRLSGIHAQRIEIARHHERAIDYQMRGLETKLKAADYHAEGLSKQDPTLLDLATDAYNQTTELLTIGTDEMNQATQLTLKLTEQIEALTQ